MKKKFMKSTIILIIGGFITKLLGMLIKIVMAREIGSKGLGLYMLLLPTFTLFINLSQFGFPIALSKLISEDRRSNKKLFFSVLPIIIIINISLIIIIILFAPFISNYLLHNKDTYLSIISMSLVIPFTTISSICRSYFFGKEMMVPHVLSNIVEDITRLLLIKFLISFIKPLGYSYTICFLILSNVISEIMSTITLLLFLPKNIRITKSDLIPNKSYINDSLKISIPNTCSRFIGSIGYFLEPIILTTVLLNANYSINYITKEYGIITGYCLPLILLPSFFTLAISQALLPIISKAYTNKQKGTVKKALFFAIFLSLLLGGVSTLIFFIKPTLFLKILYHTDEGSKYIRVLAPVFILQYIQAPLSSFLDAIGESRINLKITFYSTILRTTSLFILSYFFGIWGFIISTIINILFTTYYLIITIKKYL